MTTYTAYEQYTKDAWQRVITDIENTPTSTAEQSAVFVGDMLAVGAGPVGAGLSTLTSGLFPSVRLSAEKQIIENANNYLDDYIAAGYRDDAAVRGAYASGTAKWIGESLAIDQIANQLGAPAIKFIDSTITKLAGAANSLTKNAYDAATTAVSTDIVGMLSTWTLASGSITALKNAQSSQDLGLLQDLYEAIDNFIDGLTDDGVPELPETSPAAEPLIGLRNTEPLPPSSELPSPRETNSDNFKDICGINDLIDGILLQGPELLSNGFAYAVYVGNQYVGTYGINTDIIEDYYQPLAANAAAFPSQVKPDPLVIDLDGDGIELVNLANSTAFFDVLNTGTVAMRTGWVAADDGMLVMDMDADGLITSAAEMFHDNNGAPLTNLLAYDTNQNGLIDAGDTQFADFQIWQDLDQDGVSDTGELMTLAQANIQSISLSGTAVGTEVEGNEVTQSVTVTYGDSSTTTASEVIFANEAANSIYVGDYDLKLEAIFLPHLRGGGFMPNLHIAVSLDDTLLNMVRDLDSFSIDDMATFKADIQAMMLRWADVETVATTAHGDHIDGRFVEFLNAYFGIPSQLLAGVKYDSTNAAEIAEVWSSVFADISTKIAVQGPLSDLFLDAEYSFVSDTIELGRTDFAALLTDADAAAPADDIAAANYWSLINQIAQTHATELNTDAATVRDAIITRLEALSIADATSYVTPADASGADVLIGSAAADLIESGAGDDIVFAGSGDDTIVSLSGSNVVFGGAGNDTATLGDGNDYFNGGDGVDTLSAGAGDDIAYGGAGNDTLSGNDGNDTLYGDDGNDRLYGGAGNDVLHAGLGNDEIEAGAGDDIVYTDGGSNSVYAGLGNDTVYGGDQTDVILGDSQNASDAFPTEGGDDTLYGAGGIDIIYGHKGNDTLVGGTGNDELYGGEGSDTYIFNLGDGQDTINEQGDALGVPGGQVDVVSFGAGIAAADVTFSDQSGHLVVSIDNTTDKITIINWNQSGFEIEEFRFADGSVIHFNHLPAILAGTGKATNVGQLIEGTELDDTLTDTTGNDVVVGLAGGDTLTGGAGDDVLFGREGDDVLSGGAGNDWLYGNAGSDEYQFDTGFGADVILDQAAVGETNHVTFGSGIATADATFSQVGNNLQIAFDGTTDSLTVQNWFADSSWQTTQFSFADSTNVAAGDVANILANGGKVIIPLNEINGTSGSDTLNGTASGDLINALDGNDIVYAEGGDDTVYGGAGADSLHGGIGDDTIYGEAGDDYIYGGDGDDHIHGGTGLDILYGGNGSDTYYFNIGDGEKRIVDSVEAGQVNKVVFGAGIFKADLQISSIQEDDLVIEITVQSTGDKIRIFDWNDVNGFPINQFEFIEAGESLTVQEANDAFRIQYGTTGDDVINSGVLDDILYAGAGNDTVRTAEGDDELYGGDGNDNLYSDKGSSGTDVGSGNDLLDGGAGDDNLYAGAGDDVLIAGAGNDHMRGEAGNDTYHFNIGDGLNFVYDQVYGGDTNTILFGVGIVKSDLSINRNGSSIDIEVLSTGDIMRIANWDSWNPIQAFSFTESGESLTLAEVDQMLNTYEGTSGIDNMVGNSNDETFYGYEDADNIYTGLGNDTLYGGDGADKLYSDHSASGSLLSGGGDDIVYGGAGNDSIKGGGGDDTLYGEADNDTINGDDGNDTIYGGIGNDINRGGDGDDYLDGGDGIDYLQGGNDNDILVYDSVDARIWGDAGEDTLLFATGGESADLSNTKIRTIERVDMTNSDGGTDQLTLTMADVLRVSDTDIMRITGDSGDEVTISDTLTRGADTTLDSVNFASFTASGATLYVQLGLDMNGTQLQAA